MFLKKGKQIMKMKIEQISPCRIAYIRQVGPYGAGNGKAMERLKRWAESNGLLHEQSIILGIAHDNPETTKPESCRYDTCLVISEDESISGSDVSLGNLSGGNYSIFQIDHTSEAVEKAWNDIFPELRKLGCQFDQSRPILERYQAVLVKDHSCEICVPIC